jgi:predicted metal-dependent hydrolase
VNNPVDQFFPDTKFAMRLQPDRVISVRQVRPRFESVKDRLWFRGDRFRTAIFNAYTLLLCDEFEFVSIVRKYLPDIQDEKLREQLKSWLGQEASHGVQHRKARICLDTARLRYHGYHKIENFLIFRLLFPCLGTKVRIGLVAALEHFNTLIGEMCLHKAEYFSDVNNELGLLLSWHFAEEIEHRAVIHDVSQAIGVGYFTRVATGFLAFILYTGVLFTTAFWFALQSFDLLRPSTYFQLFRFVFIDERFAQFFFSYAYEYLSPRFHPLKRDSDCYSEPVFKRLAAERLVGIP